MRAVVGSVTSSKPISLSKAASVLSRFAAGDAGAGREVSAYLRRASAAFTDLLEFHRQLRDDLRSVDVAGEEEDPKTPIQTQTRGVDANGVVGASPSEKRSKKKREQEREGVENGVEALEDDKQKKKRKHSITEEGGAEDEAKIRGEKKKRKHSSMEDGGAEDGAEIRGEKKQKKRKKNAASEH